MPFFLQLNSTHNSYSDFRAIFPLEPQAAHEFFTKYFQRSDESNDGARVALVAETWGALVLCSLTDANNKVKFLFDLHDRDKDHRLNRVEVSSLIYTHTLSLIYPSFCLNGALICYLLGPRE